MSTKKDETKPVEPAGPDQEAEQDALARAEAQTNPTGPPTAPPAPPAKGEDYPDGEGHAGVHEGPPRRINCPNCGHSHQPNYAECQRCGTKLPKA